MTTYAYNIGAFPNGRYDEPTLTLTVEKALWTVPFLSITPSGSDVIFEFDGDLDTEKDEQQQLDNIVASHTGNNRLRDVTDFPNVDYNAGVLTEQIDAAGLSVGLNSIDGEPHEVVFQFDGNPTAGDETLLDGVIAAHQGDAFDAPPYKYTDETGDEDDSGGEVTIAAITDVMPPPGEYFLSAGAEIATTSTTGTEIAKWRFYVTKNGNEVERQEGHNGEHKFQPKLCAFPFDVVAGQVYSFRMTIERQGAASNPARYQRVRIRVKKDK